MSSPGRAAGLCEPRQGGAVVVMLARLGLGSPGENSEGAACSRKVFAGVGMVFLVSLGSQVPPIPLHPALQMTPFPLGLGPTENLLPPLLFSALPTNTKVRISTRSYSSQSIY